MSESMIGTEVNVCDCGPSCKCGYRSKGPSSCHCGTPTAKRRILAEDEHHFYVAETGQQRAVEALVKGELKTLDGRALQSFAKISTTE
jgi:hypothetical protein